MKDFFSKLQICSHLQKKFIFYAVLILMNVWMIGKNVMEHHYLKKKIFIVAEIWKILLMRITRMQKEFVKIFE